MSDSITGCTVYKNADGSIQGYSIIFSFSGVSVPVISSAIYVGSSMVPDITNLTEVKALACVQASAVKAMYANISTIITLNGPVAL